MRHLNRYRNFALGLLLGLPLAAAAATADHGMHDWQNMQQRLVSAQQIMRGNISNGLNPFASVINMVLTPDHDKVEYVLFRSTYPYTVIGGQTGFVAFDDLRIWNGAALSTTLTVENLQNAHKPKELKLTPSQAANRLVSNIIGSQLYFDGGTSRTITNLLIDRKTGEIADYVVDMDPDSLFDSAPRAVPADRITVAESRISTNLTLGDADNLQTINPDYL